MSPVSSSILLFWFLFFSIHICLCFEGCIESERDALLQFKNGLSDPSNRLADWVGNGSDCCGWTGVVCHNKTGAHHVIELHLRTLYMKEYSGFDDPYDVTFNMEYVIQYEEYYRKYAFGGKVSSSLLQLRHLRYLDLSYNDFGGVSIPEFIGSMQSLRYLNLSNAGFGGTVPPQLGNLSNLLYLNLQSKDSLYVENLDWVSSLSSLEFLDLTYLNLSQSFDWLKVMNSLPSLHQLHLSYCHLPGFNLMHPPNLNFSSLLVLDLSSNYFGGPIPNVLQNMTSFLRELDLSHNNFNSTIPSWLYDLTHLQVLNLRFNYLQGQVSSRIGNLTSLVSLDLSWNAVLEFEQGIPNSFQNFCNLRSLHLPSITLNQEINDILEILSSGCVSDGLQLLDLRDSQLSGHLTDDIGYFKDIFSFDVSDNLISGPIPLSLGEMNSLVFLNLKNNILSGSLPVSFGNLKNLEKVDISNNQLEGVVSHLHFKNLTKLSQFYASRMRKNIALRVSSSWIPPLQLETLDLKSWNIGSEFPRWLRLLKHLRYLDLSDSGMSTPIPLWFWDLFQNYNFLNFSHNQMHGSIPNIIPFANHINPVIDLSSNNFSGAIPYFSSNITALDLSHNSFSGSIHHFLCHKMHQEKRMQVLNLERNRLSGEIPDCWGSWINLAAVKLSNNKFCGNIPHSIGTLRGVQSLHLRNNNLTGEVPSSIRNCKMLVTLDFSENNLVGNIQPWIGDGFVDLRILSLHANKFDGYLPKELCHLVSLHILDLVRNSFSSPIPSCFSNFTRMAIGNETIGSVYVITPNAWPSMESTLSMMKGKLMEYSKNLGFVTSIDLSNNNFYGEIPTEITTIVELLSLNLSRNALTGRIPNDIGNMKALEAIDFSRNQLSGEIPQSMSTLTFLSTLDLSNNNLSGRIPLGTQLQGFNSSSFMGNQLCGLPLSKNCRSNDAQPTDTDTEEKDENEDEIDIWFYVSMAFGFVLGFWSVVGSLIFMRR